MKSREKKRKRKKEVLKRRRKKKNLKTLIAIKFGERKKNKEYSKGDKKKTSN